MAKAQSFHFGTLFILVVVIIVIVSGAFLIKKSTDTLREREFDNLAVSISSGILKNSKLSTGSKENAAFILPSGIGEVCLVDRKTEYNNFIRNELNFYEENFGSHNLFLGEKGKFISREIEQFVLEKNPLCVKAVGNKINLEFSAADGKAKITAVPADIKIDCSSVRVSGNGKDKIDVVFLPFGYNSVEDFENDVKDAIEHFKLLEPIKSNFNKINFYSIGKLDVLDCKLTSYIQCDNNQIIETALKCPNDYIIVLVNRNNFVDIISHVRSASSGDITKINTADKNTVLLHEFGHIFANLADEYTYEPPLVGFNIKDSPNCDKEGCEKWANIDGTGCYSECTSGNYFRPTENSLMRNLNAKTFGPVNEKEFEKRLGKYN